ncbi:MAG TPA: GNAT family N-acetyltransferase [Hyphomicrobiaceae bacterium]|nr:GNAT family N-acetyltransferase [Hyphomicrobiaceae bacterium]
MVLTTSFEKSPTKDVRPLSLPKRYRVAVERSPRHWLAAADAEQGLVRTPFQAPFWLEAWYHTLGASGEREPVLVTARDETSGQIALLLPWMLSRQSGLRVVEPADGGVSDYNGPILGPAAPQDAVGAADLWRDIKAALPPADLVRIEKMPREIAGKANPLALISSVKNSPLWGHVINIEGTFLEFLASRGKHFRKEIQRSRRVLEREGCVSFRAITDPGEAQMVFDTLEAYQGARMREAGVDYRLDEPATRAFYRRALADGLGSGEAQLFSLEVDGVIVAAVFGIADQSAFLLLRIANAGERWRHCSPGRLIAAEIIEWLMAKEIRCIDMTIGDYAFKRQFDPKPYPLVELVEALSWRALPVIARHRARDLVHRNERLLGIVRRVRGRIKG